MMDGTGLPRVEAVIRAASDDRPTSDFYPLRQEQRVLHVDTKISNRVFNLGMTEQNLDGTDVSRRLVDHRRLRPTERVSPIFLGTQTNRGHSLINEAGVLPRAHVICVVDPAWESIVLDCAAAPFESDQQTCSHVAGDLELNRTTGLLLNDDRSSSDLPSDDNITNSDLDQVAAVKLVVDRKVEQGAVANAALTIEEEANSTDLLLGEWTLRSYLLAGVPSCALTAGIVKSRVTPCEFSSALIGLGRNVVGHYRSGGRNLKARFRNAFG